MKQNNDLIKNIEKMHTTELGILRIKSNLKLKSNDVVSWCKQEINKMNKICRKGKNWYVEDKNKIITINAHSYTIITAHKKDVVGTMKTTKACKEFQMVRRNIYQETEQ